MIISRVALSSCLFAACLGRAAGQLPRDTPQNQGFSPVRLGTLDRRFADGVAKGEIPGAVVMIARNGKLVYDNAFGYADQGAGTPMTEDTVFALASMSKPVTSVAAMILVEEGLLSLDEPVSRYLPELKGLQVLQEQRDASGNVSYALVPAQREPTIQDLMRHTSGFVYGQFGNGPVHKAYMKVDVWSGDLSIPLSEMITRLSKQSLAHQPGTTFEYSISTDVLGRVIEVVSGKPLNQFIAEHVAGPLHLRSLLFHVDAGQPFAWDPKLSGPPRGSAAQSVAANPLRAALEARIHADPPGLSGGGGLFATAGDYLRFAQMLLNGGELDGVRILSPKSVMLMTSDHLSGTAVVPQEMKTFLGIIAPSPEMGQGFGLGFAVRTMPGHNPLPGSVGDFYWAGITGVYFWVDPAQKLVAVSLMAQSQDDIKGLYWQRARQLVYQALETPYPEKP